MNCLRILAAILLVSAIAVSSRAAVFSGRLGLSSYLWERSEVDSSDTRHWQNVGSASLRLDRIAGRDIEICTSLRGRYDVRNAGDNLDDYCLYNLQARWRDIGQVADLTAGRHLVPWPAGAVSIDGASAVVRPWRGFDVAGYIGLVAPEDGRFKVQTAHEGRAFGAQLGYHSRMSGSVALFFAELHRVRFYGPFEVNNLAYRTVGLDWRRPVARFGSLYGQFTYETPTQRIGRVHLSARWQATPKVAINGQFRYRRPHIPYNSIFWVFGEARYYEGRLRTNVRLNENWSANVGGAYVDLVEGHILRYDLGVAHRHFDLTLHAQSGKTGSTFGVSGEALYPVNSRWTVRGGTRYDSYDISEDQAEANIASSWWAGVRWNWLPESTLDLEGQFLTQNIKTLTSFAGDKSDFRIVARISWWFFQRLDG